MGDHARRALRPRRLAIRAGPGGTARGAADGVTEADERRSCEWRVAPLRYSPPAVPRRYAPVKNFIGSSGIAPLRISKCSWGALTLPVWPERAITWPRLT